MSCCLALLSNSFGLEISRNRMLHNFFLLSWRFMKYFLVVWKTSSATNIFFSAGYVVIGHSLYFLISSLRQVHVGSSLLKLGKELSSLLVTCFWSDVEENTAWIARWHAAWFVLVLCRQQHRILQHEYFYISLQLSNLVYGFLLMPKMVFNI